MVRYGSTVAVPQAADSGSSAEGLAIFSLPWTYSVVVGALAVPVMVVYGVGGNAWLRAINRPPPPRSVSGWNRVVGSPIADLKAEIGISWRSWKRFGLLQITDLLESCVPVAGSIIASVLEANLEKEPSAGNSILGCSLAATLSLPLSILNWQIHNEAWRGWASSLPLSSLGRSHWRALPAKIVELLSFGLLRIRLADRLSKWTGLRAEPLGWLAADIKRSNEELEHYNEEEQSTAQMILRRAYLWALSQSAEFVCNCFALTVQVPALIVWNRMMREPDGFGSVVDCVRHIWATEGLGGFYRDLPLFVVPLCNCMF